MADTDARCKHCGRRKGDHKAKSFNCPATRYKFTYYLEDQFFEPKQTRKSVKPKFVIGDEGL